MPKTQNTKPSGQTDLTLPWQKPRIPNRRVKSTSRYSGKNPEYQTVGSNRPHVTVAKTQNTKSSGQTDLTLPWKKPRIPNRRVEPTSRYRGKNPEYQTVRSNRPHGNVATNKPSGQTDLMATWQLKKTSGQTDLTATWQLINRRVNPTSRSWN